jgi:hypothetical protein
MKEGIKGLRAMMQLCKMSVPLLLAALSLLLGACAKPVLMEEPLVQIQNRTGKTIQQFVYRTCGSPSMEWEAMNQVPYLPPLADIVISLPVECADLRAFYADGKIAGTQAGVKKKYPFRWTLY